MRRARLSVLYMANNNEHVTGRGLATITAKKVSLALFCCCGRGGGIFKTMAVFIERRDGE